MTYRTWSVSCAIRLPKKAVQSLDPHNSETVPLAREAPEPLDNARMGDRLDEFHPIETRFPYKPLSPRHDLVMPVMRAHRVASLAALQPPKGGTDLGSSGIRRASDLPRQGYAPAVYQEGRSICQSETCPSLFPFLRCKARPKEALASNMRELRAFQTRIKWLNPKRGSGMS